VFLYPEAERSIEMPSTVRGAFAGTAATSQQAQSGQLILIGAALLGAIIADFGRSSSRASDAQKNPRQVPR